MTFNETNIVEIWGQERLFYLFRQEPGSRTNACSPDHSPGRP